MLNGLTLQYHYEGAYVASSCTLLKVEILAFGRDASPPVLRAAPAPRTPGSERLLMRRLGRESTISFLLVNWTCGLRALR